METLLVQKFRRQIGEGSAELLFARDGVEALDMLAANGAMDMVSADINMPRMDGLTLLHTLQVVETLELSVLGPLLNDYLTGMTDIVFAHDGTVAKIGGDVLFLARPANNRTKVPVPSVLSMKMLSHFSSIAIKKELPWVSPGSGFMLGRRLSEILAVRDSSTTRPVASRRPESEHSGLINI
jgi:response regulator RpfG family c-di-GMP phosphodiesterase